MSKDEVIVMTFLSCRVSTWSFWKHFIRNLNVNICIISDFANNLNQDFCWCSFFYEVVKSNDQFLLMNIEYHVLA